VTEGPTDGELRSGELRWDKLAWAHGRRALDRIVEERYPVVLLVGGSGGRVQIGAGDSFVGRLEYDGAEEEGQHIYTLRDQNNEEAAFVVIEEARVESVSISAFDGWAFFYILVDFGTFGVAFGDPHHVQ
jgi:hypothetical protein